MLRNEDAVTSAGVILPALLLGNVRRIKLDFQILMPLSGSGIFIVGGLSTVVIVALLVLAGIDLLLVLVERLLAGQFVLERTVPFNF